MRFSDEIIFVGNAFTIRQAPSFESPDYIANRSGELHLYNGVSSEDNEFPASFPPISLLRADLEVLT